MRWVEAREDDLLYVREAAEETLICLASRASTTSRTVAAARLGLTEGVCATPVFGDSSVLRADGRGQVELPHDGPSFHVWRAPAPRHPGW